MSRFIRCALAILLLAAAGLCAQDAVRSLTILHTNDLHAHLLPDQQGLGGFAALAAVVRRERAGCRACLWLNAGDLVQGTPVSTIFHGLPIYEISNLLGFDAATLGNHDFDYGWQQVQRFMRAARYPVVACNVVDQDGHLLAAAPYVVLPVNGIRVGIIGAVMGDLSQYDTPDKFGPWHALPVVPAVRKYADALRGRADLIVVLGHLEDAEEAQILREVPEVAVVVSGHDHHGLTAPDVFDGRLNVRVNSYGREIGRLDLQVNVPEHRVVSWKWRRIPVEARAITPAPDVAALVAQWEDKVSQIVDVPVGESRRQIAGPELKRLIERAMKQETGADFAFMNQGGVRDILPKGRLLARQIWNIMPFDNIVEVGRFPGSQIPPVVLDGRTVDPHRQYTLAVTDFTAANEDGPGELHTAGLLFPRKGPLLRDLLIDWVRKQKVIE
jgi:5'-nucleotidase / UDP-sugar diphosphatase